MNALIVLSAVFALAAACLSWLAWRASRVDGSQVGDGDRVVLQHLRDQANSLGALQVLVRDETERSRSAQTLELTSVGTELRHTTQQAGTDLVTSVAALGADLAARHQRAQEASTLAANNLLAAQGRGLADLRTALAVDFNLLRTEVRQSNTEARTALLEVIRDLSAAMGEHYARAEAKADVSTQTLADSQRASMLAFGVTLDALAVRLLQEVDSTRTEQAVALGTSRTELSTALATLGKNNEAKLEQMRGTVQTLLEKTVQTTAAARVEQSVDLTKGREEQAAALGALKASQDLRLTELTASLAAEQERARTQLGAALDVLRKDNEIKLEQIRTTVQEKLDSTLGVRLDASFKQVSDRLESVHKGLGEMQTLAQGVGSLQRTLTNVRTRGEWGELALEALLRDVLSPDQYVRQHRINPHSSDLVDFAIKMPGGDHGPVWLGIDAKFPSDVYDRLQSALEAGDADAVKRAGKALEDRVLAEAASISSKYVAPPFTTDFAVLYLPTEGLFAEVVRRSGLVHDLRTKHKIIIAGPTTLTALLGSLSMGFRSLAIQKRSSEAWTVLGQVKTEFEKSAGVWEKIAKQLETAGTTVQSAGVRHRAISRSLRSVEAAPADDVPGLPAGLDTGEDEVKLLIPLQPQPAQ